MSVLCGCFNIFQFTDATPTYEENEWTSIKIESDNRCNGGECMAAQNTIVQNEVLLNILDTNANYCVKRYEVVSGNYENRLYPGEADGRCQAYTYEQTSNRPAQDKNVNLYGQLAYSYIARVGSPTEYRPYTKLLEESLAYNVCLQDNNSGYIWQRKGNTGFIDFDDSLLALAALNSTGDCGLVAADDASWSIPSVQQLYGLINIDDLNLESNVAAAFFDHQRTGSNVSD